MLPCIVTCEHVGVIVPCSEDDVLSQLWARGCNPTESVHLLLVWAGYWHKTVLSSKKECLATGDCPRKQLQAMQGVATKGRANHPQWVPGLPLESRVLRSWAEGFDCFISRQHRNECAGCLRVAVADTTLYRYSLRHATGHTRENGATFCRRHVGPRS